MDNKSTITRNNQSATYLCVLECRRASTFDQTRAKLKPQQLKNGDHVFSVQVLTKFLLIYWAITAWIIIIHSGIIRCGYGLRNSVTYLCFPCVPGATKLEQNSNRPVKVGCWSHPSLMNMINLPQVWRPQNTLFNRLSPFFTIPYDARPWMLNCYRVHSVYFIVNELAIVKIFLEHHVRVTRHFFWLLFRSIIAHRGASKLCTHFSPCCRPRASPELSQNLPDIFPSNLLVF